MRYCRVPAGFLRERLGVEFLPDFERDLWRGLRKEVDNAVRELPEGLIYGSDADNMAVRAARANLSRLPGGRSVRVGRRRFEDIERIEGETIVCNPPYGLRIGRGDAMPEFIRAFGDFLKRRCTGSTAYVYFGKRELVKSLGLRPAWRKPLANGGLDGRLLRLNLFAGPRKGAAEGPH